MDEKDRYRRLYNNCIIKKAKLVICVYDKEKKTYEYRPYSHSLSKTALNDLFDLVIDNAVFYAFSEDEIIRYQEEMELLDDLKDAARYAFQQRLPKRKSSKSDGTTGEIILDILLQVFEPDSEKLIVRPKYKQIFDNNEIKGYDALYFTRKDENISLWLGQVKTGDFGYCRTGIINDLENKYLVEYLAESMFYIADKSDPSIALYNILKKINKICLDKVRGKINDEEKIIKLIELLKDNNIIIKIPCLMIYSSDCYNCQADLIKHIKETINNILEKFENMSFNISDKIDYEVIFCIFPVQNIQELRSRLCDFRKRSVQ